MRWISLLLVLGGLGLSGCAAAWSVGQGVAVAVRATADAQAAPAVATDVPTPVPAPAGLSEEERLSLRPNEIGWVLVLEYHLILAGEDTTYSRTPDSLRADLAWLYRNDYYPIRFQDLAGGRIDIPAGKSPVVLTFDDSDISQFRILEDGSFDPDSAMGILMAFSQEHPDFPPVATFFPLQDVDAPERVLWGQPELVDQKLKLIVDLGGEIGSHTVSHERLDLVSEERIRWQLAYSSRWLEERIGDGYKVVSLSLPFGAYPQNETLIHSGESEGITYAFAGAAEVAGGAELSPYAEGFDPYHIARAQVIPDYIDAIYATFESRPTLKYVSDGDPNTLTVPSEETLDPEQQGIFDPERWQDRFEIVRYARP